MTLSDIKQITAVDLQALREPVTVVVHDDFTHPLAVIVPIAWWDAHQEFVRQVDVALFHLNNADAATKLAEETNAQ